MELVQEVYEADIIRSSTHDVDGVPILHLKVNVALTFDIPIQNLEETVETGPSQWPGFKTPIWSFEGGIITLNSDDRGPDGPIVAIQLTNENRLLYFIEARRRDVQRLHDLLERERNRQQLKKQRANKKQKGRNLAAFRQTMGNRRPVNVEPGAWYYGSTPNPVPELLAEPSGPGEIIASFLSGKKGLPKSQAHQVEHQGVRIKPKPKPLPANNNNMPNLVRNGARARRTRRRKN